MRCFNVSMLMITMKTGLLWLSLWNGYEECLSYLKVFLLSVESEKTKSKENQLKQMVFETTVFQLKFNIGINEAQSKQSQLTSYWCSYNLELSIIHQHESECSERYPGEKTLKKGVSRQRRLNKKKVKLCCRNGCTRTYNQYTLMASKEVTNIFSSIVDELLHSQIKAFNIGCKPKALLS